jgi:hypothetical protein
VKPTTPVPWSQCGATATGFEVRVGAGAAGWQALDNMRLDPGDERALLLPVGVAVRSEAAAAAKAAAAGERQQDAVPAMQLRYLFADWPTPTVYDAESFLGPNGELPLGPFVADVDVRSVGTNFA